jgi:hypothetical protein
MQELPIVDMKNIIYIEKLSIAPIEVLITVMSQVGEDYC